VNVKERSTLSGEMTSPAAPGGFGVLDDEGRVSLPQPVRSALGLRAGSPVAYVILEGAVLLVPQDEALAALTQDAERALSMAGLTAQDILDELPAARDAVVSESYGAEFLEELGRLHAQQHPAAAGG
jgi:bifunctional DNA-binding transcriptional regulator/antitoxin component of YhaV-PrlF toxin-antitoxin module